MGEIFIQVASYRDPELVKTITDAIQHAKHPDKLIFGICWQYHPGDSFTKDQEKTFAANNNIKVVALDISAKPSPGVCWARNQVQQLYDGEQYTLQIDSHMRFGDNWDVEFIQMIKQLQKKGHKKPLLTGYVSSFNPDKDPEERVKEPWRMTFDRFIPEGAVFFLPETIPDWETLKEPVPCRFYSAHFCFTLGAFAKEVQHDPEYYFHGEEISIAARAFTHGYDLFHPHKTLIWHEYTRRGRTKQWDDDPQWVARNDKSHKKNRKLFGMDGEVYDKKEFGIYGFGKKRTLRDYEKYAGLLFERRAVQQYVLDKKYPPDPQEYSSEAEWKESFLNRYKHCIDIQYDQVPEDDYKFWVVALHDKDNQTIFRRDAQPDEIRGMKTDPDKYCKVWVECNIDPKNPPDHWVIWPFSESKEWCERLSGKL